MPAPMDARAADRLLRLKQSAERMMKAGAYASAANAYESAAVLDPADSENLLRLQKLAEHMLREDDADAGLEEAHTALRQMVAGTALLLPCLVVLALAHGASESAVSFTMPSGRTLRISTEHEGAAQSSNLAQSLDEVRAEGRDLNGWTGGSVWEAGQILTRVLVSVAAEDVAGAFARRVPNNHAACSSEPARGRVCVPRQARAGARNRARHARVGGGRARRARGVAHRPRDHHGAGQPASELPGARAWAVPCAPAQLGQRRSHRGCAPTV